VITIFLSRKPKSPNPLYQGDFVLLPQYHSHTNY
jgi:hypothetical protein